MTDKELERSVRTAFDHATPNVLDSVLENCQGQKGKVITMTNKKKNPWISRVAAVAAALALVVGLGLSYQALKPTGSDNTPASPIITSTVLLDVNPSIELTLNADERVTAAAALNDDGAAVLDGMDLTGSDLEVAMNAVIGAMLRKGYLTNQANTVLVSVSSTDDATGKALQAKLNTNVNKLLNTDSFNGAVISQTVNNNDELKTVANENQISLGKAKLIQRIMVQNTRYTFEELAALSINELNLLTESGNLKLDDVISSGAASEAKYIGGGEAKRIALADAGITEKDMRNLEIGLDLENGIMVYEIEFDTSEYEYEYDINAITGEIVWKDKEYDREDRPATPPVTEPSTPTEPSNTEPAPSEPTPPTTPVPSEPPVVTPEHIDKDAALNAAFDHAGIKAADATQIECELDRDHGIYIFEIEFRAGDYEYDYDINAETGTVVRYEKELDKKTDKPVTPPETPAYISADRAKSIALEHAGVTVDGIYDYSYELEIGHGKARYEIEFETTETEFEYVIDAKTGTVISFNKEANGDRPIPPPATEPPAEYISKDAARAAVLNHAGIAADTIRNYSCELDNDDGRAIYEIEFESGKFSYEYEIDAATGAVINSDKEMED